MSKKDQNRGSKSKDGQESSSSNDQTQGSLFGGDSRNSNSEPESESEFSDQAAAVLLGLASVEGLGFKTLERLFDSGLINDYLSWEESRVMQAFDSTNTRLDSTTIKAISRNREEYVSKGRGRLEALRERNISVLMLDSSSYPRRLRDKLDDPPRWLFVKGNISALHSNSMVALIGTREPSKTGMWIAEKAAKAMARRDFVVISGLARGIDSASHSGAVDTYAQSVAVLGHGLEVDMSREKTGLARRMVNLGGAIVSEYLPSDPPSRDGYLRRNEVVAALSGLVIPVECPSLQSGTGSTIRRAQKIGTPVAGITPERKVEEKSLKQTVSNLQGEGIKVLTVLSHRSEEFWTYMARRFPDHDWDHGRDRIERFIGYEAQRIVQNIKRGVGEESIDASDIEALAQTVRRLLKK